MDLITLKIISVVVLWSIGWYKVIDNVLWHFVGYGAQQAYENILGNPEISGTALVNRLVDAGVEHSHIVGAGMTLVWIKREQDARKIVYELRYNQAEINRICTKIGLEPIQLRPGFKQMAIASISKPVWACIICYGSVWGTIGYLLLNDGFNVLEWMFCCVSIAGINAITNNKLL